MHREHVPEDVREKIAASMREYWAEPTNRVARREAARIRRLEKRRAAISRGLAKAWEDGKFAGAKGGLDA